MHFFGDVLLKWAILFVPSGLEAVMFHLAIGSYSKYLTAIP